MTDRPKITNLYAECASPDNIRINIKKARATRDRWQRHVDALGRLLDTRLGQIDAGTWPAPAEAEEPSSLAAAIEVRRPCPHCPPPAMIPRTLYAEHLATMHPLLPAATEESTR